MKVEQSPSRKPRVLVTRAADQASSLAQELELLGAKPLVIPVIEIVAPDSYAPLDDALRELQKFEWLVFTSANAVTALPRRAAQLGVHLLLNGQKIAAIGSATARALQEQGWEPDLVPSVAIAESLTEALLSYSRNKEGEPSCFLLVRAQEARDLLPDTLRDNGAQVTIVHAYKTQMSAEGADALREEFADAANLPNAVTLTSSSSAKNFFELLSAAGLTVPADLVIASIGPITTATLRELGHPPHVEAEGATVRALAEATMNFLEGKTRRAK